MATSPASTWAARYWRELQRQPAAEHQYASLLGLRSFDPAELHARVEQGLAFETLERLRDVLDLPLTRFAELVRIPSRTLGRRRDAGRLDPDESDRLLRMARIVGLTLRLFEGDLERTRVWLMKPHAAFGGESPLSFSTTEVGARAVEHVIGRLEHGIPL